MTRGRAGIAAAMLAAGCGTAAAAGGRPWLAAVLLATAAAAGAAAWIWWHPAPPGDALQQRVNRIAGDPAAFAGLMIGAGAGDLSDHTTDDQ